MGSISSLLRQIVAPLIKEQVVQGIASNINFEEQTCDVSPLSDKADFKEVKLKGVIKDDDTGFIVYPKDGSEVAVCIIEGDQANAFVCQFTEIDSILIHLKNGNQTVFKQRINADGTLEFNGGDLGGLINVETLLNKINQLEAALNGHIALFNTHVHLETGASTAPPTVSDANNSIAPITQRNEIEDVQITHGTNGSI